MEILWLIIGIIIGLVVAWWFLTDRCRKRLDEKEKELANVKKEADQKLEAERDAHDASKIRLSEFENAAIASRTRVTSLESERDAVKRELEEQSSQISALEAQRRSTTTAQSDLQARLDSASREKADIQQKYEAAITSANDSRESERRVSDLEGRVRSQEQEIARLKSELSHARMARTPSSETSKAFEQGEPQAVTGIPRSTRALDDLKKIKGIGRVLEGKLRNLGITTFQQLADLTQADIERINAVLDFPGRIERERWVEQAKEMLT